VREESFQIADLLLGSVQRRCADQDIALTLTPAFKEAIVAEGFSSRYGARPLRRAVQRWVEDTLAECMLDGFVRGGQSVELDVQEGHQVKVRYTHELPHAVPSHACCPERPFALPNVVQ